MSFRLPFAEVERRTAWLRGILLSASFFGLLTSAPLWINSRAFPLFTVASWFPVLAAPWDKYFFGSLLVALVLAVWFYRPAVIYFLLAGCFMFFEDQNRGQPWFYMYCGMLLLTLLPTPLAACRLVLSAVYFWSGVQKINHRFFQVAPTWFVEPAERWHLPAGMIELLRWAAASAPFVELAIGIALWFPRLRRVAIAAALLVHAFALIFLGPTGHNYNFVVWPWNLAMISLVLTLFMRGRLTQQDEANSTVQTSRKKVASEMAVSGIVSSGARTSSSANSLQTATTRGRRRPRSFLEPAAASDQKARVGALFKNTFAELRRSRVSTAIVTLIAFLPILGFGGWWDSFFCFSVYSENQAVANIFVTSEVWERFPPHIRPYVKSFAETYDPVHQCPYMLDFPVWCYETLHVPPSPEPRNYRSLYRSLRIYSREPGDLRMIIGQRAGPVIFIEGDRTEYLTPL